MPMAIPDTGVLILIPASISARVPNSILLPLMNLPLIPGCRIQLQWCRDCLPEVLASMIWQPGWRDQFPLPGPLEGLISPTEKGREVIMKDKLLVVLFQ